MKYLLSLVQINHYPERYKKSLEWILKLFFTGICLAFIVLKIDWTSLATMSWRPDSAAGSWMCTCSLMLMPLNWILEAMKWQRSVSEEQLSFGRALQAVLCGLALNWVVPFTLGDAGGRLWNLQERRSGVMALAVNRMISLGITGVFGGVSVLAYFGYVSFDKVLQALSAAVVLLIGVGWWGMKATYRPVLRVALLRYAVFTFQFYLLIEAFFPDLNFALILSGIGWIFLFRSFIPSIFGNFGVREASALLYFEHYLPDSERILVPCLLIWMINTVIPSLVGACMIFKLKVNIAR